MGWYGQSRFLRPCWRPLSIADANRYSVSWSRRNDAADRLDDLSFEHQRRAAESAFGRPVRDSELKIRPQRGPLFTEYPAYPAARACAGLSAIAEFKAHAGDLATQLRTAAMPSGSLPPDLDPASAALAAAFVAESVANRLCIDQLRLEGLATVESYRLFAAATIDLRFRRLKDVILAATTMGDLVSGLVGRQGVRRNMHPLTCRILDTLAGPCRQYEAATAGCRQEDLPLLGEELARRLMAALLAFLPRKQAAQQGAPAQPGVDAQKLLEAAAASRRVPRLRHQAVPPNEKLLCEPLAGSDEPGPPGIEDPPPWQLRRDLHEPGREGGPGQAGGSAEGPTGDQQRLPQPRGQSLEAQQAWAVLREGMLTLSLATGRSQWDDPRVDQVTQALRHALFTPGVVEAELASRRQRVTAYGSGREGGIHEVVLPRCRDEEALRQVREGAAPVAARLRGYRWLGQRWKPALEHLQTSGPLDPRRLSRLATSSLLRRKWRHRVATDYRGRPVVVLAKDGSSSNSLATTFAGKILAAAFLRVERLARIRLVAADYSSDRQGHVVRWLYHPQKTPGRNSSQAAEAVASLSPAGVGGNEDVLSLSFIMREVLDSPFARGQTVIVINITDGRFNSRMEEVRAMVRQLREDHRLTYSLVILGDAPVEVPEADYTVRIPGGQLQGPREIADRIAGHVNLLVRSLRRKPGPSHAR